MENLNKKKGESFQYRTFERMPKKPYPDPQGVINAYELGCIKAPEARQVSPLALWDLHYLRELDNSGFINKLYRNESETDDFGRMKNPVYDGVLPVTDSFGAGMMRIILTCATPPLVNLL